MNWKRRTKTITFADGMITYIKNPKKKYQKNVRDHQWIW